MATPLFDLWFGADNGVDDGGGRSGSSNPLDESPALLKLTPEDEAIVRQLRDGDASTLEALHHLYWAPLTRSVARLLGSADAATDVVQDVFADLWIRRATWTPHRSVATYLFRAARNRALHIARDSSTEARWTGPTPPRQWSIAGVAPTPSDELSATELNQLAHATLAALPPRCCEAFLLYAEQRLELREVAAVMGIAEGTAQLQLKRAMAALRKALDAYVRGEAG